MLNKKLIARLRSLEDLLGVRYSEPTNHMDWGTHTVERYGIIHDALENSKSKKTPR